MSKLTQSRLKKILHYNPTTGIFTRKLSTRKDLIGKVAGSVHTTGKGKKYIQIGVGINLYYAHRLAHLYMDGEWPRNQSGHEDGNGLNNKWKNLSEVTNKENSKNARLSSKNTSGFTGVNWHKTRNRWMASIRVDGRRIYLGSSVHIKKATKIRRRANVKYGFHVNHGAIRPL